MQKLDSSVLVGTAFGYLVIMESAMELQQELPTAVDNALDEQNLHTRDTVR